MSKLCLASGQCRCLTNLILACFASFTHSASRTGFDCDSCARFEMRYTRTNWMGLVQQGPFEKDYRPPWKTIPALS